MYCFWSLILQHFCASSVFFQNIKVFLGLENSQQSLSEQAGFCFLVGLLLEQLFTIIVVKEAII